MYNLFSSGVKIWVVQRLSAIYISVYLIGMLIYFNYHPIIVYLEWRLLLSQFWFKMTTVLFLFSVLAHSWIGLRDVILDYAPNKTIKLIKLTILMIIIIGLLAWGLHILL